VCIYYEVSFPPVSPPEPCLHFSCQPFFQPFYFPTNRKMCREYYLNSNWKERKIGIRFEKNLFHCSFAYHKSPTKYSTIENGSLQRKASPRTLMCESDVFVFIFLTLITIWNYVWFLLLQDSVLVWCSFRGLSNNKCIKVRNKKITVDS
jgi:hypothetical protein